MRIAALFDIHGNLPALEALLAEVASAKADRIVVGGDVVPGPMCAEVLELLGGLDVPVDYIFGNGEVAVLAEMAGGESVVPAPYRESMRWVAGELGDHQDALARWPLTARVSHPELGDILFCHATPRNENEIFTRLTSEQKLEPIFAGVDASIVVCGHTHMQFDRYVGNVRVVNAGSVGMPFGRTGSDWLLLGPTVQLRHFDYDLESAAARVRKTQYPMAEEFASRYLLDPPSEETMLAAYGPAELR